MRKIFFFILLATFYLSNAQQPTSLKDSLLKYQNLNPNLALQFGLDYIENTSGNPPSWEIIKVYSRMGEILLNMELYSASLEYFNSALRLKEAINTDQNISDSNPPAWIVLNIGNIYYRNGDFVKAKEKFLEAEALFKVQDPNSRNTQFGLNTSSNIGLIYGVEGNFDKQEELFYKVYESRKALGKADDILYSMLQLMTVNLLKIIYCGRKKLQEIIQFYALEKEKLIRSIYKPPFD